MLYAHSIDLLRAAPATLQWYCCSFAGVDPYCQDPSLFANPDCLLTNTNAYGVTIAEHVVMVTLMLLRRMPEYAEVVRSRGWRNDLPIRSIRGSDFTILGTGDIGSNVADRLRGMGAASIVYGLSDMVGAYRFRRTGVEIIDEPSAPADAEEVRPLEIEEKPASGKEAGLH